MNGIDSLFPFFIPEFMNEENLSMEAKKVFYFYWHSNPRTSMFSITFDSTTSSIMAGKNQKKKKNQLCVRKKQYIPSMVRNTMQNPLEFQKREKCRRKYSEELINNMFRTVYKFLCVYEGLWHSAHTVSRIRHGNLPSKQVTQNPTAHLAFFPGKIRKENKWGWWWGRCKWYGPV